MDTHPAVAPELALDEQQGQTFSYLVRLMRQLLAQEGCPWDREQDEKSLRRFVLEEACEVIDAIDSGDPAALCDELGDLALQIVFLAELARIKRQFGPDDVVRAITEKLVRRHPHVFAQTEVAGPDDVVKNWDAIKRTEKSARPLLDSVPRSLPALQRAQRLGEKVARVGFDWPSATGSRDKIAEELAELDEAVKGADLNRIQEELGDVLFALINFARHLGVDADGALRGTCERFTTRFAGVERQVLAKHGSWPSADGRANLPLSELDDFWENAKLEDA
jgi:tetrapyrrole methylase family protein/MazG family protein/ATP diphosphatase